MGTGCHAGQAPLPGRAGSGTRASVEKAVRAPRLQHPPPNPRPRFQNDLSVTVGGPGTGAHTLCTHGPALTAGLDERGASLVPPPHHDLVPSWETKINENGCPPHWVSLPLRTPLPLLQVPKFVTGYWNVPLSSPFSVSVSCRARAPSPAASPHLGSQ